MARRPIVLRKRRTREHVIADLGVNFVERQALLCGFSVERVIHDYGIDLFLFTYDKNGMTETAWIPLQVKATNQLRLTGMGDFISFRVEVADLRSWLEEPYPVILIVYDAIEDLAYWLYVQNYFGNARFRVSGGSGRRTIRIPIPQVLNPDAIRKFAGFRDDVLARWQDRSESHE
jgi:hypothetical protein